MGWGPEPIWSTGFVDATIQACPSGSCVSLKVQVEDGSGFTLPGQYVQVRPAGGECFVCLLNKERRAAIPTGIDNKGSFALNL